jgi:hypothetical protein
MSAAILGECQNAAGYPAEKTTLRVSPTIAGMSVQGSLTTKDQFPIIPARFGVPMMGCEKAASEPTPIRPNYCMMDSQQAAKNPAGGFGTIDSRNHIQTNR